MTTESKYAYFYNIKLEEKSTSFLKPLRKGKLEILKVFIEKSDIRFPFIPKLDIWNNEILMWFIQFSIFNFFENGFEGKIHRDSFLNSPHEGKFGTLGIPYSFIQYSISRVTY